MSGTDRVQVAVLLTCHNRKNKTLQCLEGLHCQQDIEHVDLQFFLVDDGSSDGTREAVVAAYPSVHIVQGSGQLFWAGGMRQAWKAALAKGNYHFFWLVNDDTVLYADALKHLLLADVYALETFAKKGLYVASTRDGVTHQYTYGGHRLQSKRDYRYYDVIPDGTYQSCDLCNANSLLVSADVFKTVGILSDRYTHALADYDYSLRAVRAGFPVLVLPNYGGECSNDHFHDPRLSEKSVSARMEYMNSPKGYAYKEFLYFTKTFFPNVYIRTWVTFWIMTLFPKLWSWYKK